MLEYDQNWPAAPEGEAVATYGEKDADDRRRVPRYRLRGGEVYLFDKDRRFRLRLKDLCCHGVSGLTDAPVDLGQTLIVQLEEMLMPAAQVVWTRRAMAGFAFINPVPLAKMRRICDRHAAGGAWSPAMRAGSDMHSWWMEIDAHFEGRRPTLNAGGHAHPLPR